MCDSSSIPRSGRYLAALPCLRPSFTLLFVTRSFSFLNLTYTQDNWDIGSIALTVTRESRCKVVLGIAHNACRSVTTAIALRFSSNWSHGAMVSRSLTTGHGLEHIAHDSLATCKFESCLLLGRYDALQRCSADMYRYSTCAFSTRQYVQ
jgi:hypothetical protein